MAEPNRAGVVEISTSSPDDFDALHVELRGAPGITVEPGETSIERAEPAHRTIGN